MAGCGRVAFHLMKRSASLLRQFTANSFSFNKIKFSQMPIILLLQSKCHKILYFELYYWIETGQNLDPILEKVVHALNTFFIHSGAFSVD